MPMFNSWVPEPLRPWIYLLFALLFQLTGGVYFGLSEQMSGSLSLLREDIQMIAMFGVVGVNMPFPFLFRFKLRFTNRQLLINAALVIAVCNVLALQTDSVPLLCALSYVAGFFKLCGTFECFSNIRLWISPRQDFGVFLPTIYIIILLAHPLSNWTAQEMAMATGSWQTMHWFVAALMLMVALVIYTCTHAFRFMKPLPLVSLDWLGCLLWSAVMLEIIWLFTYGEYYNWNQSAMWRSVLFMLPLTLGVAVWRMLRIRHPYIDPKVWPHARLVPILAMFFVAEVMNATPHALQNALTGGVLHWGFTQTARFYLAEVAGSAAGCAFTVFWHRPLHQKYTRLLTVGFACLLLYQAMMYFQVSPTLNIERLYLPTFLRTFGYAIFFSTMTLYLQDLLVFQSFFMSLTISGFIRNGVGESACSSFYAWGLRRQIADTLARAQQADIAQVLMVAIKQMYGWMALAGTVVLLLMLLYDVQPVRQTMQKMPHMKVLLRRVRKEASRRPAAARAETHGS
ncbi:MAG: hypothetical protein IJV27_02840 [Prevotella sp.]|nr:hypothetical protein [Prevotella sp.]